MKNGVKVLSLRVLKPSIELIPCRPISRMVSVLRSKLSNSAVKSASSPVTAVAAVAAAAAIPAAVVFLVLGAILLLLLDVLLYC